MIFATRASTNRGGSAGAFGFSASVHGVVLGWLVLSTPLNPEPRKSIYDEVIKPHEDHLVWYNLHDSLPDVSPSAKSRDRRPARARTKFRQTLVAGERDHPKDRQMIWMPEPEVRTPKLPPLPNVLAVAPRLERPFVKPPAPKITAPAPTPLPEAPRALALVLDVPAYQPEVTGPKGGRPYRQFTPPPRARTKGRPAAPLPEAPRARELALAIPAYEAALPLPPRRRFTPPPSRKVTIRTPVLPEAPNAGRGMGAAAAAYHAAIPAAPLREFTPPPQRRAAARSTEPLPEAPDAGRGMGAAAAAYHAAIPAAPLREFTPPPQRRAAARSAEPLPEAPVLPGAPATQAAPAAELAIAGLDPAKLTELPKPPGSRAAGFSAGPEVRPKGGTEAPGESNSRVVVPGLLARGGTAAIPMAAAPPERPKPIDLLHPLDAVLPTPEPRATRVSDAPDPLLEGRVIYTMAIQMPNITSYSGSWMVWFAEHASLGGKADVEPPVPLRKVDPKYVATAVAERVEGKVRLSAIIRRDGHVDQVVLLRHLDPRLDQTAEEALSKWIFEPARRNGVPIDVDAVFEIPFYLAPRPKSDR